MWHSDILSFEFELFVYRFIHSQMEIFHEFSTIQNLSAMRFITMI